MQIKTGTTKLNWAEQNGSNAIEERPSQAGVIVEKKSPNVIKSAAKPKAFKPRLKNVLALVFKIILKQTRIHGTQS